jgi:hypothetical protein
MLALTGGSEQSLKGDRNNRPKAKKYKSAATASLSLSK